MMIANSNKVSTRNRHFLMRHGTVRDAIKTDSIKLKYTPTDLCKADGLTKALLRPKHNIFCDQVRIVESHVISLYLYHVP